MLYVTLLCLGCEQAGDTQVLVICLDVASFHIEIGEAQARHYGLWQLPAVDGYTIGFTVDIVEKVSIVILRKKEVILQIIFRAL